ncbi:MULTISPECIES: Crp/Fnr family transcriptional regulator [Chryseobacterium]|uniref:CRP-like cAMP-binding protein n=2 Tax=Chryseobacterium TaxID=59732 RepID=A0AAE4C2B2_9FLAO|nr:MULTISPECIES: Crp/Fnr family transcriptional regulator [Chryseobacterium]MBL3547879.1 Crp/Fnr family transcriptional regulator [Chryseobacterium sp. KMC2]MDR6525557.1 CRP-like cAMP-binding protein [Chryseobacterium rhizosphaerae]SMC39309.1 cAMP-binding domain of CRP or a regulatory subunit of cAMP-dependent protein kinases [Chryseobacterium sp. YR221]
MDTDIIISQLIEHFREIVPLKDSDIDAILPKLEIIQLKKKDYLLHEGQISRSMRFIAEGSLYAYHIDEKGKENITQLGIENWWVNDLYSYLSELPSRMFIRANEKTTVIQISKNNLELLYKEVPAISEFWRLKMQSAYVTLQERTFEHSRVDAYTKYRTFVTTYRNIEQRFPQYMIASYLGITVEYLSYLRKKHLSDLS